jgi:hypothetical protein
MDLHVGFREEKVSRLELVCFNAGLGFFIANWERVHRPAILAKVVIQEKQLIVLKLLQHAHFLSFGVETLWPLLPLSLNSQLWQISSTQVVCSYLLGSIISTAKTYIGLRKHSVSIYRRLLFPARRRLVASDAPVFRTGKPA